MEGKNKNSERNFFTKIFTPDKGYPGFLKTNALGVSCVPQLEKNSYLP